MVDFLYQWGVANTIANSGEINAVTIDRFQSEKIKYLLESTNHSQTNNRIERLYEHFNQI